MLSIRFDTLCGSFCLRLASTCNHRPDHARFIIIKFSHSRCQPQKKGCHKTIMVSRQSLTCSRRAINKPSSVRFHAMIIYLVKRLPVCSSDSDGVYQASQSPDCWCALTAPFHPYHLRGGFLFYGTFPKVSLAGRYPASCPAKLGLSSRLTARDHLSCSPS